MDVDGFRRKPFASMCNPGRWLVLAVGHRVFHWLQGRLVLNWSFVFASGVFMLGVACMQASAQYPKRKEQLLVAGSVLACLSAPHLILGSSDITFQHRAFGFYAVLWRTLLPTLVTTFKDCIFVEVVVLINELWTTRQCFAEGGEDMPFRVVIFLVFVTCIFTSFYQKVHMYWEGLRTLQWELSEEKKAQETLISMLCSSCAHIGRDANSIIRSSVQFDEMLGQNAKGSKLTRFLADDKAEVARVESAFARARVSPVTLPMTLFSGRGTHKLDVFIVRRRTHEPGEATLDLGFLLGFRFSQDGMEDPVFASELQDTFHMQPLELSTNRFDMSTSSDWDSATPSEAGVRYLHAERLSSEPILPVPHTGLKQQPTFAWCEDSALPKPLTEISRGECVLCYDNLARGLTLARSTTVDIAKENSDSDWVTIGFEDDSCIRVKADHPVAIQEIEDCSCLLQSGRRCVHAADLQPGQHTLLVVRILPMVVTTVQRNPRMTEVSTDEQCFAISVEHPERYEPLVASFAKDGSIGHPIAIGSYDRWIDRLSINTKNTFLCLREYYMPQEPRSVRSAPPSLKGGALCAFGTREVGQSFGKFGFDCGSNDLGPDELDAASMVASSRDDSAIWLGPDVGFEWGDAAMSSQASSISGGVDIKVGAATAIVRLSEWLSIKASGSASLGSICSSHDNCTPCCFHFTHCKYPDRRPCKQSYLCEYCHDDIHLEQWRSKLRKLRSAKRVNPASPD